MAEWLTYSTDNSYKKRPYPVLDEPNDRVESAWLEYSVKMSRENVDRGWHSWQLA